MELIERSLPEGATMTAILEGRIQAPFSDSPDADPAERARMPGRSVPRPEAWNR